MGWVGRVFFRSCGMQRQIQDNVSPINDVVNFIMSPMGKVVSKEELI